MKCPAPVQSLLAPAGINVYLYLKPILEKRREMEIVVPFYIRNLNSLTGQPLERLKNGKVLGKRERPGEKEPSLNRAGALNPKRNSKRSPRITRRPNPLLL